MEQMLKAYQCAKMLNISESTFNKIVNRGEIPCVMINSRNKRYREQDLIAYIERKLK